MVIAAAAMVALVGLPTATASLSASAGAFADCSGQSSDTIWDFSVSGDASASGTIDEIGGQYHAEVQGTGMADSDSGAWPADTDASAIDSNSGTVPKGSQVEASAEGSATSLTLTPPAEATAQDTADCGGEELINQLISQTAGGCDLEGHGTEIDKNLEECRITVVSLQSS